MKAGIFIPYLVGNTTVRQDEVEFDKIRYVKMRAGDNQPTQRTEFGQAGKTAPADMRIPEFKTLESVHSRDPR